MSTQTKTPKKAGPKAAPKTTPKAAPKATVKTVATAAPKAETAVEPKVVALAVVEEAAAIETGAPAAAVEAPVASAPAAAKGYDDFAGAQKDSVDAFVKAGEVIAKGVEELTRTCFDLAQDVAAANAEAAAAMLAVKSLEELVGVQNELARKAFDRSIAEGERISGISLKIANEAFEPIQAQFTVAVEKAFKPLAA